MILDAGGLNTCKFNGNVRAPLVEGSITITLTKAAWRQKLLMPFVDGVPMESWSLRHHQVRSASI